MKAYWKRLMIMLWLLSQMLGSALPALPVVAEPETLPCRAWEKTQSVNKAYDAGCRSPLAYDVELAEVAVARWSEFDILTQAAFSYDCAPSFLSRKVDYPRAPPFGEGRFLAAKTPTANGSFYSVAFKTKLNPSSYPGVTRYMHFKEANTALEAEMQANPALTELGISVPKSSTGAILGKSPEGWVWHHSTEPGVMQLVPKSKHPNIPGGIFWDTMHPGGIGGFAIWGN